MPRGSLCFLRRRCRVNDPHPPFLWCSEPFPSPLGQRERSISTGAITSPSRSKRPPTPKPQRPPKPPPIHPPDQHPPKRFRRPSSAPIAASSPPPAPPNSLTRRPRELHRRDGLPLDVRGLCRFKAL
jgi:hypothetical protein